MLEPVDLEVCGDHMNDRREAIDALYGLLDEFRLRLCGGRLLGACTSRDAWPRRGVYFLFEPGELREDGVTPRVVRVGTHGLTVGSKSTLWARLRQHRGTLAGSHAGGGNHRGSVFRLHVGTALLASPEHAGDPAAATWAQGSSAPAPVRVVEAPLERAVSAFIGRMSRLGRGA